MSASCWCWACVQRRFGNAFVALAIVLLAVSGLLNARFDAKKAEPDRSWSLPWGYDLGDFDPRPSPGVATRPSAVRLWEMRDCGLAVGPPYSADYEMLPDWGHHRAGDPGTTPWCHYRVTLLRNRLTGAEFYVFGTYDNSEDGGNVCGWVLDREARRVGTVSDGYLESYP